MVFDLSVKYSLFGNFQTIQSDTQTVMKIITAVQLENFLPSTFSETTPAGSQLRIRFLKVDNSIQVLFGMNRIDIIYNPITYENGISLQIEPDLDFVNRTFSQIISTFNKLGNRLAFNTSSLFYDLPRNEIDNIDRLFKVGLPYYSQRQIFEWGVHLVTKEKADISGQEETLNVITNVSLSDAKIELHDNQGKLLEDKSVSAYKVDFDINTNSEELDLRFTGEHLSAFIGKAMMIKGIIQSQLLSGDMHE